MTRGVFEMTHFRFLSAFGYNPLVLFLPLMLGIEILNDTKRSETIRRIRKIVMLIFLAGLVVLGVGRTSTRIPAPSTSFLNAFWHLQSRGHPI